MKAPAPPSGFSRQVAPPPPEGFSLVNQPPSLLDRSNPLGANAPAPRKSLSDIINMQIDDIAAATTRSQDPPFRIDKMLGNLWPSTKQFADDMTYPVRHPVKTYEGLRNLVQGVGDKAGFEWGEGDQSVYVDAVVDQLKQRYGGTDAILQTLESDPVGLASDVAGILMTGGSMTGIKALSKVGAAIDPIHGAARIAKTTAQPMAKWMNPNDMYQEVTKFSTVAPQGDRKNWAQVGLDERITSGSQMNGKYSDKIDVLTERLNTMIDDVSDGSEAIPVDRVLAGLDDLKREKGGFLIDAETDVAAIDAFKETFLDRNFGRETVTPRQLQDFKTDAYKKIDFLRNYKQGAPIDVDIRKNVGRAAKEGIEEVLPEVKSINSELGGLLDAKDPLIKAWNRIDNRNKASLIQTLFSVGGATATGSVTGMLAGFGFGWLLRPELKAQFAVVLNELAKNGGNAKLVDSALLEGITNTQVQQLTKLSGRLGQLNEGVSHEQAEQEPDQ
jgi:hypothetical protein